jgi:hypothetical protein
MATPFSTILIVILISIGLVGFFFLGMSLTQIFKGHDIDSEIATNKNMQRLGIKCAVQESREDTGTDCEDIGCHGNCSSCDIDHDAAKA